ncbi:DUF6702 family protein [Aquimarina agarivorans]|uniref:DUF6702 family protein n=1 Tax=Aquimarina agarivorans TaxID=980584 RepID=UPI000248ED7F|nr:DUF6702 family protein [Aquimarina agarivorans]
MLKIGNFRRRFFTITVILTLTTLLSFSVHKYYASITKIEISQNEGLVKIYTQVFVDDFEKVLQQRYQLNVSDFENLKQVEKETIGDYVTKKIKIKANRTPLKLRYLGGELKNELFYIFLEADITAKIKRFDVENKMLQDVFSEQQNTIDVTNNKSIKSLHLHAEKPTGTIYY